MVQKLDKTQMGHYAQYPQRPFFYSYGGTFEKIMSAYFLFDIQNVVIKTFVQTLAITKNVIKKVR